MEHEQKFETFYYTDQDKEKFYSMFMQCMRAFGCGYIGYVYEDTLNKSRLGFATNPDWQKEYIGSHIIDDCHLWNAVSKHFVNTTANNFILYWEDTNPNTSRQKDIRLYRMDNGIGKNGISFCTRINAVREYLAFAPENNRPQFLSHLSTRMDLVRQCCSLFRSKSYSYMQETDGENSILTSTLESK